MPEAEIDQVRFLVLHTLKINGIVGSDSIAEKTGIPLDEIEPVLSSMMEQSQVRKREGRVSGFTLLPDGTSAHASLLDLAMSSREDKEALSKAYTEFLSINSRFKHICTEWQLRGPDEINDHTDPEYDAKVLSLLSAVHSDACDILGQLSSIQGRYSNYHTRLENAYSRVQSGDISAFVKPMSNSYHDIWMELHQDLLTSLKLERTDEDGA